MSDATNGAALGTRCEDQAGEQRSWRQLPTILSQCCDNGGGAVARFIAGWGGRRPRGSLMQARSWMRVATLAVMGAGLVTGATAQTAKAPAAPEWSQTVTKEPTAPAGELD